MLRRSKVSLTSTFSGISMPPGKRRAVGIKKERGRSRSRSRSRSRAVQQKNDKKKNQSLLNALSPTNIGRTLSQSRSRSRSPSRSSSVGRRGFLGLAPQCHGNATKRIDKKAMLRPVMRARFPSRSRARGNTSLLDGENRSACSGTSFSPCNFVGWWCGG